MNGYMIYEPPPPGHICEPPAHIHYATDGGDGARSPRTRAVWQCDCGRYWVYFKLAGWVRERSLSRWWRKMRGRTIWQPAPGPACSECDQPIYEGEESVAWADAQGVGVRHSTCPARSRGTVAL